MDLILNSDGFLHPQNIRSAGRNGGVASKFKIIIETGIVCGATYRALSSKRTMSTAEEIMTEDKKFFTKLLTI